VGTHEDLAPLTLGIFGSWGAARSARAFTTLYPDSTVEVIAPDNIWEFAGVP